ncbi:hypothetical protein [Rhodococcus opacus]|uniref:hypothetical protein n=1 Tax=Rhodococcus opacus TaxID=37919 RepID=UPI0024B9E517|nr:hypothetical protein [Rhodococcus opacus]MDJ0413820.1 hypothetical protein [Rhodococcus opacus]
MAVEGPCDALHVPASDSEDSRCLVGSDSLMCEVLQRSGIGDVAMSSLLLSVCLGCRVANVEQFLGHGLAEAFALFDCVSDEDAGDLEGFAVEEDCVAENDRRRSPVRLQRASMSG